MTLQPGARPVADFRIPELIRRHATDAELWTPRTPLGAVTRRALEHLPPDLARELLYHVRRAVQMEGRLYLAHHPYNGLARDLGLVSEHVITDAGVGFIVDAFQNLTEIENLKYHGIGTGGTAEAASQTALVTELTTQYSTDNTRATGSTTENAANIYRTVGTNQVDSAVAITEHGIFSQAATGGGTMLDRSLFSAVNLGVNDSLQSTYDLTLTSGG